MSYLWAHFSKTNHSAGAVQGPSFYEMSAHFVVLTISRKHKTRATCRFGSPYRFDPSLKEISHKWPDEEKIDC